MRCDSRSYRCVYITCSTALAVTMLANGASAGQTSMDDVEEILVTAQKVSQRLIDVPVAVTEVTAAKLMDQDLVQITDYYSRIPSLQISGSPSDANGVASLSLRGITTGGGTNPTVAILVDDVPFGASAAQGRPPMPDLDPAILERIEVLRGPQGTLYGASSLGGLIKFVTKEPDLENYSGHLETGANTVAGGNDGWSVRGSANLPLLTDKLALLVSGFYRDDPSWVRNISSLTTVHTDANESKSWGGNAKIRFVVTDDLTVTASAMRQTSNVLNGNGPPIPVCAACVTAPASVPNFIPRYGDMTIDSVDAIGNSEFELYSARINYNFGWAQLTSTSAWNTTQWLNKSDVTLAYGPIILPAYGLTGGVVDLSNANHDRKFSQEVRLSSTGPTLDWLVGAFYTKENEGLTQALSTYNSTNVFQNQVFNANGPYTFDDKAMFGDVTYHVAPKTDIQVGARVSHNNQGFLAILTVDPKSAPVFGPGIPGVYHSTDENSFTWLITPSYHFTSDLMGYARIATGYRPGGPNPPFSTFPPRYSSDHVINYELGLKGYVAEDHKISFDVSLFQIDWHNIQLPDTDPASGIEYYTNGKDARSRGLELAGHWNAWQGFSLDANATFVDAVLTENLPLPSATIRSPLIGLAGDRLPATAKISGNLSAQQDFAVTDRTSMYIALDQSYIGDRYSGFVVNSPAAIGPRFLIPAYWTTDLRAGVIYDKVWTLNLYGRNIFNSGGIYSASNGNGTVQPTAYFIQPRTVGFTVGRNF